MALLAKKVAPKREYELTYLVGNGYTSSELNSIQDAIIALIGKNEGEIVETQDLGKKTLAYKIKKDGKAHEEAVYTCMTIRLSANKAMELRKSIDFKREVLRSLLIAKK